MKSRSGFAFVDLVILAAIITAIGALAVAPLAAGGRLSNERTAVISLKTITTAEADFRSNDRDGNRVMDFWTADVYGLYGMISITGAAITPPDDAAEAAVTVIKLLEPSTAASDGRTDQALYGNLEFATGIVAGSVKKGYILRALHNQVTGGTPTTLLNDTDGARQFYGACHDNDRFAFIAFPTSLKAGRSLFVVNEDNTIWRYFLPAAYTASFTGASGAATDSTSTAGGAGLAIEFTLTAHSGQGTFPAAPATLGGSQVDGEPQVDWNVVLKGATLSMAEGIDKGLADVGESAAVGAEIEADGGKTVCVIDVAKGKEVVVVTVDLKDGKVLAKETAADDQSKLVKDFKMTAKEAIEAALKKVAGHAVAFERGLHRGRPLIYVRVWSEGKLRLVTVNGEDGAVIGVSQSR